MTDSLHGLEIAIIGMAGRFPGAPTLADYWRLLAEGREGIRTFDDAELRARGATAAQLAQPGFVKAGAPIADADRFDATLFGFSAREAELMDPQQRLFLECAWQALEDAGIDPEREAGAIGIFGGAGMNGYLLNLYGHAGTRGSTSPYEIFLGNDKDFLATRVAYKLGLRGPAVAVQTACSSSLVAVHLACQSLLAGECDIALAGGVALSRQAGYLAAPGGIHAADGHCRPFSADAAGTVPGNGVGLVVLRRLVDAQASGGAVRAVIKGSALNNDGSHKQSFTAPSGDRQAAVIDAALAAAGVGADSVDCVEAHGTGTALGDPIEFDALARVFRRHGAAIGRTALGSVKGNIGHLDAAAGIAGLIKLVLALQQRQLPPTLHAAVPHPQLGLSQSPFHLAQALADWPAAAGRPRRAAVSSFGIGGTNVHLVLDEAPTAASTAAASEPAPVALTPQLMLLSAHSAPALAATRDALTAWLATATAPLATVARTLQQGRRALPWRLAAVATEGTTAAQALAARPLPATAADTASSAVWLFSGQGSQRPQLAQRLYAEVPAYRAALDACAAVLNPLLPLPLQALLCQPADARAPLTHTAWAQPALFAHEWALAAWWRSVGLQPRALAGHSLGEWVAATLAGVFSLPQALRLVATRGRLMQAMPAGAMWAVAAAPEALAAWLHPSIAIAAHNAPQACVLAGPAEALAALAPQLAAAGFGHQPLHTEHAFHTPAMDEAAQAFRAALETDFAAEAPQAPRLPFVSGVHGRWVSDAEATSPAHWARQLRDPVLFAQALQTLQTLPAPLALEIGPGRSLAGLAQANGLAALASQPQPGSADGDGLPALLQALGQAWCAGLAIDAAALNGPGPRTPLPGLVLQGQRYWIDADAPPAAAGSDAAREAAPATTATTSAPASDDPRTALETWFSQPGWRLQPLAPAAATGRPGTWLLLDHAPALAAALAQRVEAAGDQVFTLRDQPGLAALEQHDYRAFALDAAVPAQWQALQAALAERALPASGLVDLRALHAAPGADDPLPRALALAQALAAVRDPLQLLWVTRGACALHDGERPDPAQAALLGLALVPGQENPALGARVIDLAAELDLRRQARPLAARLAAELRADDAAPLLAWRGSQRWAAEPAALPLPPVPARRGRHSPGLRRGGHYVVLGDFERGLGALWAERLLAAGAGRLSLVSATVDGSPVPPALLQRLQSATTAVTAQQVVADDPAALRAALDAVHPAGPGIDGPDGADGAAVPDGIFVSLPTTHAGIAAPLTLLQPSHGALNQRSRLALLPPLAAWVQALQSQGAAPAFCCLQSSMSAQLGGLGLAAYAAASQALDAFAQQQALQADADEQRTRWLAIDWDPVALPHETPAAHGLGQALQAQTLSADEAWAVTERALAAACTGVLVVSRTPLAARRQAWLHARPAAATAAPAGPGLLPSRAAHPRPPLATPYAAPRDAVEQQVATLWQDLLRLEQVGVNDSFFDLGGHSLLAIQAVGRLRQLFPVTLELRDLLDGTPTVAGIAAHIGRQLAPAASTLAVDDESRFAALLAEVQALSPEDVQAQLQQLQPLAADPTP